MKDLRVMKVDELRDIAREYCLIGTWKMTKDQLIENILKSAELNGHDMYFDSNAAQESQIDPELTEEPQTDNLSAKEESSPELILDQNNGWELIAKKQLKNAYDQIVGGCENSMLDGELTREEFDRWLSNEAINEVYHEAITTQYHKDACGGPAPTEMRFAGKEFCYKYLERLFKNDGYQKAVHQPQDESGDISSSEIDNLSSESEEAPELNQELSKLKSYAAWVVDRETKEITSVISDAESRVDFYNSIKDKYRVRLITKPEKLEEECKEWEIKHARNKIKKNEKYAHDKEEAAKMNMKVGEYRKWLRESAKISK